MEKFNKDEFLKLFNSIKSKKMGFEADHRILNKKALSKFTELKKLDYGFEHFEKAIKQMFTGDISYIVERGLNTPIHLLVPDNFERYLNAFINAENLKKIKEAEKQEAKEVKTKVEVIIPKVKDNSIERIESGKIAYSESLIKGEWVGTNYQAWAIGELFGKSFEQSFKSEIFQQSKKEYEDLEKRSSKIMTANEIVERIITTPTKIYSEKLVKEAVKRKIKEPWL